LKKYLLLLLFLLILISPAFAIIKEDAKASLDKQSIPFTKENFVNYAAMGNEQIVNLFLDAGIDPNSQNVLGWTALMYASLNNFQDITNLLLNVNANVNIKTNNDETAIYFASMKGNKEIVELLLAKGADPNIKTKLGQTPLSIAKALGKNDVVTLLQSSGKADSENRLKLPENYPKIDSKTCFTKIDDKSIEQAKQEAVKEKVPFIYYLGYKAEIFNNVLTETLTGVAQGKTTLYCYLATPYLGIKYEFYKANKQFKPVDMNLVNHYIDRKDFAGIIVSPQDVGEANLEENSMGYLSNQQEAVIANVVIRKKGIIYQSVSKSGNAWVFPIDLFSTDANIEIIAVDQDNVQKILKVSGNTLSKFK